jgi:CBS domain-containing protein
MKRVNIRDAFVGEPNRHQEGLPGEDDAGLEALLLAVRGGELTVVLPAGTDAAGAVQAAECLRGVLRLEHERVLTFEIQAAATGAFFEDEPAALHRRRRASGGVGLSAIQETHDYMAAGAAGADPDAGAAPRPLRARDAMTPDPVTARPDLPVRDAADRLVYHRVSGLPVLDGAGALVGVVSEADVIGKRGATVGEIMSREVVAVAPDARLEEVAALMTRRRVNRVPVVHEGRLVGILSRADVVRWAAR